MKKRLSLLISTILVLSLIVTGCGGGTTDEDDAGDVKEEVVEEEQAEEPEEEIEEISDELTFGDTFEFNDFTVALGEDYSFDVLDNQFSDLDGDSVIVIPVTLTNNSGETKSFNQFYYTIFSNEGLKAEGVSSYFDNSVDSSGDMRDGATGEYNFYIHYTGDGDYFIEFEKSGEEIEVKLPIEKAE